MVFRKEYLKNYEQLEKETENRNKELQIERDACLPSLIRKGSLSTFINFSTLFLENLSRACPHVTHRVFLKKVSLVDCFNVDYEDTLSLYKMYSQRLHGHGR